MPNPNRLKPNRLEALRRALQTVRDEDPPAHLVAGAIALHGLDTLAERFSLLAASSEKNDQSLLCVSQSGLWTLEIFVGKAPEGQPAERGQVLLSVHPDHRATYEGRQARIFVHAQDGERVLAEAIVRDGELFADVSLAGLDLHRRDAVNVVFSTGAIE
ncbi:MAG TPA: hypothetical protein VK148_12675 [Xanthobacteraceae bacterium]|jgi:hypothetical protein|nr:hypothetical protein [Xanthobacteraceae bacterium]